MPLFAVQEDQDLCLAPHKLSMLSYIHSQVLKFAVSKIKEIEQVSGGGSSLGRSKGRAERSVNN